MRLTELLVRLVTFCARRAVVVAGLGVLAAVLCGFLAANLLGVTTDTDTLFSPHLAWRQRSMEMARLFPQEANQLVIVIDASEPEAADETASALAKALAADTTHFLGVERPDASPYFDQEGLLFLDSDKLAALLDQTISAQPFLGQLVQDPSARGLFSALSLVGMGVAQGQANLGGFDASLEAFHQALADALAGHPRPLSWENLLAGQLVSQAGKYRFVLAHPRQDFGALEPGGAATAAIRADAAKLPFVQDGLARVRITGGVALADEEFATVAKGAVTGLVGSAILVTLWLFLALRSWRLVVPVVLTLLLGLLATTGFAAMAVGTLNLISVAFAILFVGIAVDFAIQFSVRFRELGQGGVTAEAALAATAQRAGVQILVAACATAAGFLAFVPTEFVGVAQLGLIAGVGMLVAFLCTLTFLPAALTVFRPKPASAEVGFRWARPLDAPLARARVPVLAVFGVIAVAGVVLLPQLQFDSDPLHTKDPNTEAMQTLNDLLSDPLANPYTIEDLAPSLEAANALAARLARLPLVAQALTLQSLVPDNQQEKLDMISQAASILDPTLTANAVATPVTAADIRMAAQTALAQIDPALPKLKPGDPLHQIAGDLHALTTASDATVMAANAALTRFLPLQLDRLREALTAHAVTARDVPAELARNWVLPDGRAKVQLVPTAAARSSRGMHAFVQQVQAIAPDAGGSAVTIVETADTILTAFRDAAIGAIVVIAVILFVALRRPLDVALVMAPLLLSALTTVVVAAVLPLPLNFANIIALPLLLGVGVSFNIYFVMNWRAGQDHPLGSATARAVVFSALTTGTAFGSLALSEHPGTASMGKLLLLSLGCTLVASLVFVPALLAAVRRPKEVSKQALLF
jgi:hopanoid biosynthesis associated RND transporter like protein HpnN